MGLQPKDLKQGWPQLGLLQTEKGPSVLPSPGKDLLVIKVEIIGQAENDRLLHERTPDIHAILRW